MKTIVPLQKIAVYFILSLSFFLTINATAQTPELVFTNPVLKSGNANREGAVYRFSNVTSGVDAEVKLKKFSRNDITMVDVDLASLGWDKAFQPQFGINGNVPSGQNWYIDFEIGFFKAATNTKQKIARFDLTSLDVDGDGVSIAEYVNMEQPDSVAYSSVSYLTGGGGGTQSFICPEDGLASPIIVCPFCILGDDIYGNTCPVCDGSGKIYSLCQHAYTAELEVQGPVTNFYNIDTAATQVMATYTYLNRDKIKFRIGATSGSASSTAGVRLNSMWFRSFSLTQTIITLPVRLTAFTANYQSGAVDLNWKSAAEYSFSHYEIERSIDGVHFTAITQVKGNNRDGESSSSYSFEDNTVPASAAMVYYRLKLVDIDNRSDYSAIRSITIRAKDNGAKLALFPNPVVNDLHISIPLNLQGKNLKVELFNSNGQLVKTQAAIAASHSELLDTRNLGKGLYTVRITGAAEVIQSKIVKI